MQSIRTSTPYTTQVAPLPRDMVAHHGVFLGVMALQLAYEKGCYVYCWLILSEGSASCRSSHLTPIRLHTLLMPCRLHHPAAASLVCACHGGSQLRRDAGHYATSDRFAVAVEAPQALVDRLDVQDAEILTTVSQSYHRIR